MDNVRKIAVVRANALGDFVVTLPALEALRRTYPSAEIVLLAKPWHEEFLRGRPSPIDRVVPVPAYRGVGAETSALTAELDAFFDRMRAERFDLALQMQGGGRNSNPFTLRLGATSSAGSRTPGSVPLDHTVPYDRTQHEVLRYLEIVSLVGACPEVAEPRLHVTCADREEAKAVVPAGVVPIAVLHPGAADPERRWPAGSFAAVGDSLAEAGAAVLLTGTAGEQPVVEAVASHMVHPARNLCGRLSLRGLTGLLSQSRVVVSNDTGPLHLARALGAATVGIYSAFNLMSYGPLTRLRHRPHATWRFERPACPEHPSGQTCDRCISLVASVPVEDVRASALELFADGCLDPAPTG